VTSHRRMGLHNDRVAPTEMTKSSHFTVYWVFPDRGYAFRVIACLRHVGRVARIRSMCASGHGCTSMLRSGSSSSRNGRHGLGRGLRQLKTLQMECSSLFSCLNLLLHRDVVVRGWNDPCCASMDGRRLGGVDGTSNGGTET
jgi:hypothetical protein